VQVLWLTMSGEVVNLHEYKYILVIEGKLWAVKSPINEAVELDHNVHQKPDEVLAHITRKLGRTA
jgi:hypothetical protein